MDLEQFRRAYMQVESMGNTPMQFVTRITNLATSIAGLGSAIGKDKAERQEKSKNAKMALMEIRSNGLHAKEVKQLILNKPSVGKNFTRASGQTINAAHGVVRSLNETGSTGRVGESTAAVRQSNLYGGQDFEIGINYLLKAANVARKGLKVTGMFRNGLELGVIKGLDIIENKSIIQKETKAFGFNNKNHYRTVEHDWQER